MGVATLPLEEYTLEGFARRFGPIELQKPLSKADFVALAERYPEVRMEREPNGTTTIMPPVKKGSSRRENTLGFLLNLWNAQFSTGEVYGPNGTYDLPNGAVKMPDASWISPERPASEPDDEKSYITVVPDFVVEIRSASDVLEKIKEKMVDIWMANGVRLAWLIDPYEEKVYIYRAGSTLPEVIEGFSEKNLSGEAVMPGFELPLEKMRRRV